MPSREEVYEQWKDAEECDHGTRFWCESCNSRSWGSGISNGVELGLDAAIEHFAKLSGQLFVERKTEKAELYRSVVDDLRKLKDDKLISVKKAYGPG